MFYTGSHVYRISRGPKTARPYRGSRLPGCGGYFRRRIPGSLARPLIGALEHSDLGSNILLVPTRELVSPESLIARTSINRMAGFTTMPPRDIASFLPQDGFMPPEGPFYLGRQSAHRHVQCQSRAGCGPQTYWTPMSACRSPSRKAWPSPPSTRSGCWKRTASILLGLTLRRRTRAEHLDEPERTATGSRLAQFPPYLAGQRVLHGPSRGESVPLKRFSSKDKVGKVDGDRPLSAHGEP